MNAPADANKCPHCGHLVLQREDLRTVRDLVEQRYRSALVRYGGDWTGAARSLGVSRSTFYRWAERHGIKRTESTP